jgi:hypothetical protein
MFIAVTACVRNVFSQVAKAIELCIKIPHADSAFHETKHRTK